MPIRFPTEAANADTLRDEGDTPAGSTAGLPKSVGTDGTLRGRAHGKPERQSRTGSETRTGEARPDRDPGKG